MTPRDTPGLIAYKIEICLQGQWYFYGISATEIPDLPKGRSLEPGESWRSTPIWAKETRRARLRGQGLLDIWASPD